MSDITHDGVEQQSLRQFTENAYLNYSMYVIMDRALPFIGDGLKPVQRRIVYAMSELGLTATAKFKKSARTVGDVLGKYHPHGDSACYEAMVLMAQPFSYRYPLIEGQGNWGAPDDPKSFAAMRYTESRLSGYANALLMELGQGTVEYALNYDGTTTEPKVLPARLPNILLNGSTGIAVGMATDIPPHNLNEVVDATIMLLNNPQATLSELMTKVQAPDYPTDAEIITPYEEIARIYQKGRGSLKMRAVWRKEGDEVIITALPHQVSGAKILEQIANQMRAKKLPMIEDLRDESDHENPTRLVIVPRSNRIDLTLLMNHLFATTDLEKSYRVNLNMIGLDGRPAVKGLHRILTEWLQFRRETVTKRLNYRLAKIENRLHVLQGLLTAFLNIDDVMTLIREEDDPKKALIARFGLSETQAEAILELKLRQLAKLEKQRIQGETDALSRERNTLQAHLSSDKKLNELIKKELIADVKLFGNPRRSQLVEREEAKTINESELLPSEAVTVILSKMGWIRMAKGHEIDPMSLSYKTGDKFLCAVRCKSNQMVILLDSTGRSYAIEPMSLPSARGQGEPISGKLTLPLGASIIYMLHAEETQKLLMASDAGYGFICTYRDLISRNRSGKAVMSLPEKATMFAPLPLTDSEQLLVITQAGRMALLSLNDLPQLAKGKGNKIVSINNEQRIKGEDSLVWLQPLDEDEALTLYIGKRKVTLTAQALQQYKTERGKKGTLLPRGLKKVDKIERVVSRVS